MALPLAARGVPVAGIELSPAMVEGAFGLVHLVFTTIGSLTTQDDQVAVFENAARRLTPGGRFVPYATPGPPSST